MPCWDWTECHLCIICGGFFLKDMQRWKQRSPSHLCVAGVRRGAVPWPWHVCQRQVRCGSRWRAAGWPRRCTEVPLLRSNMPPTMPLPISLHLLHLLGDVMAQPATSAHTGRKSPSAWGAATFSDPHGTLGFHLFLSSGTLDLICPLQTFTGAAGCETRTCGTLTPQTKQTFFSVG